MMCSVIVPTGHKRSTHQAFLILFHPVIYMHESYYTTSTKNKSVKLANNYWLNTAEMRHGIQ